MNKIKFGDVAPATGTGQGHENRWYKLKTTLAPTGQLPLILAFESGSYNADCVNTVTAYILSGLDKNFTPTVNNPFSSIYPIRDAINRLESLIS